MTVTVQGSVAARVSGTTGYSFNPFSSFGAEPGDVAVLAVCADSTQSFTLSGDGWTTVLNNVQLGTRRAQLFLKVLATGESTFTHTPGAGVNRTYQLVIIRGAVQPSSWVIGSQGTRAAAGGTNVNSSPAITTTANNNMILNVSYEATSASDTVTPTLSSGSIVNWSTSTLGAAITETILTSYEMQGTAGAYGPVTTTYQNVQTVNGLSLLLGIPPSVGGGGGTETEVPQVIATASMDSGSGGTTSTTINRPTGATNGDLLFAQIMWQQQASAPITPPSGWTVLYQSNSANSERTSMLCYKIIQDIGIEPTSYTWTVPSTSGRQVGIITLVRGVDQADPISNPSGYNYLTVGSSTPPAFTADKVGVLVLLTSMGQNNASATPVTADWGAATHIHTRGSAVDTTASSSSWASVASMTPATTSVNPGTAIWSVWTNRFNSAVAFNPSVVGEVVGLDCVLSTVGGDVQGELWVTKDNGLPAPVISVGQIPFGYLTVDAMEAEPRYYIAHRGGSISFPEMSLHAYTQSAARGYGALEVSLARTSDGVWFGLHDSTLDRTSGVSGVTASSLTWAQVQANYQITLGPGAARPYMRLEEILQAYGYSHVLFIDPKAALSQRTELLNKLKEFYGSDLEATKHVVAKYSGVEGNAAGTNGWAYDTGLRGYTRWGYFYEADYTNGNLATYQGRWDILGMNNSASTEAWTAVKSYGKPVIAHILQTQAAVDTVIGSFDPDGIMTSGTAVITPE